MQTQNNTIDRQKGIAHKKIVSAHALITGIVIVYTLLYWLLKLPAEPLIYPTCLLLTVLFAWSLWSWKTLTDSWFDPYSLFITCATLFNGGHAILEVFHLNENGVLHGDFSTDITFQTLLLVTLGLTTLHLGALVSASRIKTFSSKVSLSPTKGPCNPALIRKVGWALLLISLPSAFITLKEAVEVVLSSGYFALYQRQMSTGLGAGHLILAGFLVPAALFLLAGAKGSRLVIAISMAIVAGFSLTQLFLGYRYYSLMPVLAYIWLWHRSVRPLPVIFIFGGGALVLAVVLPLVGVTRAIGGTERLSGRYLLDAFYSIDNPSIGIVSEMGNSMGTVAHTLNLVPDARDYDLGASYCYALLTIFPNVFGDIHPTIAHGTAANWLIWKVNPYIAEEGGGLGYSFIAEAFLNFGWLGTPLVLALLGFFYAKFVVWANSSGAPAKLAMVACYCTFFTFLARGESAMVIRPLIWNTIAPYALIIFISHLRRERIVQPVPFASATSNTVPISRIRSEALVP